MKTQTEPVPAQRWWRKSKVNLVVGAHPAIHSVAAQAAAIQVRRLDSFERIRRQGFAFGFYIYLVKPRGVQPEAHRLTLFGDLLITKLFTHLIGHLEALEGVEAPWRRAPPQTICPPDYVIRAIVLDVLAQAVRRHNRIDDGQRVEETAEFAVDVVHLRVALFYIHEDAVPEKVSSRRIVLVALFPGRALARAVLDRRMIDDEVEVRIAQRRFLDVFGVGQVAERARLVRISLVDTDEFHPALA